MASPQPPPGQGGPQQGYGQPPQQYAQQPGQPGPPQGGPLGARPPFQQNPSGLQGEFRSAVGDWRTVRMKHARGQMQAKL
jgi:hypothetical protein